MSDTFNYFDNLRTSAFNNYVSYMNSAYMGMYAPTVQIFKLDKKNTVLEPLYGSAKHSLVFLPPFTMRAWHLDNPWKGTLNIEPYIEIEENIKYVVNFNDMVKAHRDLKNKHNADIFISYAGSGVPSAKNENGILSFFVNGATVGSYELNDVNLSTTSKLVSRINTMSGFTATVAGINVPSIEIVDFNLTAFKDSQFNIFAPDPTYANITDLLEMGDMILTSKYRAYNVLNANPTGDFGWNYSTFTLDCNLYEIDQLDGLPSSYRREIESHQWGMKKINKE
jgi:hypothetical protein